MSEPMQWIADHILWLLVAGWLISMALLALSARASWRWFRGRGSGRRGRWPALAAALVGLALAGFGVLFTSFGLGEMGPGLLQQRRMLGEAAPTLAYQRLDDGAPARLAEHRGKVVLVNLWATWCPPCRAEMPELDRLQRDYLDRGLVVLHLSDEDAEILDRFLAENPTSAEHGRSDTLPWPEAGRPTSYLVDREGVIRAVLLGNRSYEQFERVVRRHL